MTIASIDAPPLVRPFEERDLARTSEIVANSFRSKFTRLARLPDESLPGLLISAGMVSRRPRAGYLVGEIGGEVLGVIELKSRHIPRLRQKMELSPELFRYGLVNVLTTLLGAMVLDSEVGAGECYVEHIAVDASARGLGLGSILLDAARKFASGIPDCRHLTLTVAASNTGAIRLYQRLGFEIRGKEKSLATSILLGIDQWLHMGTSLTTVEARQSL